MSTRRTFAQVVAETEKRVRHDTIDELCRVLKHHLGRPDVAVELYEEMQRDTPKRESACADLQSPWPS